MFKKAIHTSALLVFFTASIALVGAQNNPAQLPVERYALYIAANDGGTGREILKYAVTDSMRLSKTMSEIGGIKTENSVLLSDPSPRSIDEAFAGFIGRVERNKDVARRTEFIFYYSGHSDDKAILLGEERYTYENLKSAIARVPTDVHVVLLDSCFSGNFVRSKGGSRQKPFLVDDSSTVQGHAYLSSSSGFESSQESDRIQASYFTHALVTGLRGAADASGDSKVSLNELYHYAFNETLSQTELSAAGPQHPSYDITLVGSGDLVLTDISEAESVLFLGMACAGKYYIRDMNGSLVSELNKIQGTEIALALPAGSYLITVVSGVSTLQSTIALSKGQRLALTDSGFTEAPKSYGRTRGTQPQEEIEYTPYSFAILPGLSFPANSDNVNMSFGLLWNENDNIDGMQINLFGGTINGNLEGIHISSLVNILNGDMNGVQGSGFINVATGTDLNKGVRASGFMNYSAGFLKGVTGSGFLDITAGGFNGVQGSGFLSVSTAESEGVQSAGFMNVSFKKHTGLQAASFLNIANEISGVQVGFINIARKNSGVSIGIFNFILDGIMSPAFYVNTNGAAFLQYQGGTNRFFTTFLAGADLNGEMRYAEFGFGIGTRIPAGTHLSFDVELLSKHVSESLIDIVDSHSQINTEAEAYAAWKDFTAEHVPSIRLSGQYSFFKHFSIFVSIETEMRFHGYNDRAFTEYTRNAYPLEMINDKFTLYPVYALGIKF